MKVVIVIDTAATKNIREKAEFIAGAIMAESEVLDMANGRERHENYFYLKSLAPSAVITLELAGFDMKTTGDIIAYNTFTCPMAHVVFDKAYKYADRLSCRQNLSMFTYFNQNESDAEVKKYGQSIPNTCYYADDTFDSKAKTAAWFEEFCEESMVK